MADAQLGTELLRDMFTDQPEFVLKNLITRWLDVVNGDNRIPAFQDTVTWDGNVGGRTSTGQATATDDPAATDDVSKEAKLPIAEATFKTTISILTTHMSQAARIAGPMGLRNLFGAKVRSARQTLKIALATALYSGDGAATSAGVVGLNTAVAATGAYAGLDQATYSGWASGVTATAGALSLEMLETAVQQLEETGIGNFDYVLMPSAIATKYRQLFTSDSYRRQVNDGTGFDINLSPSNLYFQGRPVLSDPYCPAGTVFVGGGAFLHSRVIGNVAEGLDQEDVTVFDPFLGMDVLIKPLPSNNSSAKKWGVSIYPQLQVHDRRSFHKLTGVT